MEKDATLKGLEKIKDMFSDEDKKKDIAKKSIIPLSLLTLVGGALLTKKLRKPIKGAGWNPGEREGFVKDLSRSIARGM